MTPFLIIAIGCLVLFAIALRARREQGSIWPLVQNVSAVLGIVSFIAEMFRRRRRR
jgi:cytochrome c oxidase assembly factor CtaG